MSEGEIIGRLIQSNARGFRFACGRKTISSPKIGGLVSAQIEPGLLAFGIITDIIWLSDELITQLARSETIERGILADNQFQRGVGQFIDVLTVGYKDWTVHHALPPRPPLSLEQIRLCGQQEILEFSRRTFAYFRLILDAHDYIPFGDVMAAHLLQAQTIHEAVGCPTWIQDAVDYLISLLLDDYNCLLGTLEALSQKGLDIGVNFGD